MWQRVFALLLLFTSYCILVSAKQTKPALEDVTFCELAKNPIAFSGKQIRVRAVYSYMFEISNLRSPTCCSVHESIWVDFDEELRGESKRLFNSFPKGMGVVLAVFVGRIETGEAYGTGQRIRLVVNQIDKVEAKAKPSTHKYPAWVPRDCDSKKNPV